MARRGRAAEKIVALLEKGLLPEGAEVKSPGFVADKITGELREVDVAVRYKLGAIPILIIIECRDRKAIADVLWIEQVAQKRQDLNAAKAIAVSTSGFSEAARKKAAHHGIEIRVLSSLTTDDVQDWFSAGNLILFLRRSDVKRISIALDANTISGNMDIDPDSAERLRNLKLEEPLFILKRTSEPVSAGVAWSHAQNMTIVYDGVPQDGTRIQRVVELKFPNPEQRYIFQVANGSAEVEAITFYAELWIDVSEISISQVLAYGSPEGNLIRSVQYEVPAGSNQYLLAIQRTQTGQTAIAVSKIEDEGKSSRSEKSSK